MSTLTTAVGEATVLHRLALAVECRDAFSDRPVDTPLVGHYRRRPTSTDPDPRWRPLDRRGTARFTLRHALAPVATLPDLEIVIDDPGRRIVPRRFTVTPWQLAEVAEPTPTTDPNPYVVPQSRLLRVWLLPGSAAALSRTATVVRGRVTQAGEPKRWARIQATTPTGEAGWAHADERGEFVLPIVDAGQDLVRVTAERITITLRVLGTPTHPDPVPEAARRTDDLVNEIIPRSTNPATDAELDNDVLRGVARPATYRENTPPARTEDIPIGRETKLTTDVAFVPLP